MTTDANSTAVLECLQAACQGHLAATGLASELNRLGAYRGTGRTNPIALYSRSLSDALPKIFGAGETVTDVLNEKLATLNLLAQSLSDAGAFGKLEGSVLRCLFEDAQLLQALIDLRELESKQQAATAGSSALDEVVVAAGRACMAVGAGSSDRTPQEVFWACPTSSVAFFFQQAASAVASVGQQPGRAAWEHETVALLAKALQVALGGAMQQRSHQHQWYAPALAAAVAGVSEPEWTAGAFVREALYALATGCCRLQVLLPREAPQLQQDSVLLLFDLTDRLLNAFAAAVAAAPLGQRRRALHQEYAAVRDQLLGHLLEQARLMTEKDDGEGLHWLRRVQGLAEAHAGWSFLFDIADITGDREQLYNQMQQLRGDGLVEGLATYVFARLLHDGRHAELLDLPPQFDVDLEQWLRDASDAPDAPLRLRLRWLHELRISDYVAASASLEQLLASGQQDEEAPRLAALQKLSALAAGAANLA